MATVLDTHAQTLQEAFHRYAKFQYGDCTDECENFASNPAVQAWLADAHVVPDTLNDRDGLARIIHNHWSCQHDKYTGGPTHGQPFQMCTLMANSGLFDAVLASIRADLQNAA